MSDRCGDCKFWVPVGDEIHRGECRAMPPAMAGQLNPLPAFYQDQDAIWPITRISAWCGKFEQSDEATIRKAERIRQVYVDEAAARALAENSC